MSQKSVVLGFSGGMDSVTSAMKLKSEGWRVVALTLDTVGDKAMAEKAQRVAKEIGVEHLVVDVREAFREKIINYFINSYSSGQTPAPCTVCNAAIKWQWLISEADRLGIEHIATGHYFKVEERDGRYYVVRATDLSKDQSYYLWGLSQDTLRRVITPMGDVIKSDIRSNFADKRESMGLCFLQGMAYRDFLLEHCPQTARMGEVVDANGTRVGTHSGVAFYTIGQKRGFDVSLQGAAVVAIDAESNRLVVGEDSLLYKSTLEVGSCNIVNIKTESAYNGSVFLMCVNYKVYVGTKFVARSVNTLFGRGFNVTVIRKVCNINENNIIGSKNIISHTAGSDNKLLVIYSAADVTPGSYNKTCCQKLVTGFND